MKRCQRKLTRQFFTFLIEHADEDALDEMEDALRPREQVETELPKPGEIMGILTK